MKRVRTQKVSAQQSIFEWVEELAISVIFVVIIFSFFFKVVSVNGTSMLPNFVHDDRLIVNCINFSYEKGDVVIVSDVLDEPIIKRIIATEGQTVDIDFEEGIVYIDDVALDETEFGLENGITTETYASEGRTQFPLTVKKGHVFVLGDNRKVSEDSRYITVGQIDTRHIVGKASFRFLPFDKFGFVD